MKSARWLLLVAYMGFIFYLSHQPTLPLPPLFPNADKLLHFGAYAVLGFLFAWASGLGVFWSVIFASLYGISDEFHQSFVPGREVSALDWLADSLGGLAGSFFFVKLLRSSR